MQTVKEFRLVDGHYRPFIQSGGKLIEASFAPMSGSQEVFLSLGEREVLYGGTRANGKTLSLLVSFAMHVNRGWGSSWRGVLLRNEMPMFAEIRALADEWLPRITPGAIFNSQKNLWEFPAGELLYFRPFDQPSDYNSFHGHSYSWIGIEELTLWSTDKVVTSMHTVLRSTVPGIPLQMRATTNPYGVGHNWVQMRYRLHDVPGRILWPAISDSMDDAGHREPPRRYVHGHIAENTLIMLTNPSYLDSLKASTADNESKFNAYVNGSWEITAGGILDDLWQSYRGDVLVDEFDVPFTYKMFRAYDHGSGKPGVVQYFAVSDGSDLEFPNGKIRSTIPGDLFHIGEIYLWNGRPDEGLKLLPSEIASRIKAYEIMRGWIGNNGKSRVKPGAADTSIFDSGDGRPSIAEDFAKAKIFWEEVKGLKAPGSRVQGWQQLRKRIKSTRRVNGIRETPGLFVVGDRCPQWLRTVPPLQRSDKNIDDVESEKQEDHCGDCTRYALYSQILSGPSVKFSRVRGM